MGRRIRMTKKRWKREQRLFKKLIREGKQALKQDARSNTIRANA